jgi:tetratricopeptide (TPR) repeat protein
VRRALATALALALLLAAAGCEFLPGPLDGFRAAPPPPPPTPLPEPEPETTWLEVGRELLAADRPDEAGEAFIRSLRVEGVTAAALTGAGIAAERQGMLSEARRHFEAARLRAPRSATVHLNLGAVLYRMGELYAARRAFEEALALSGGTSEFARRNIAISEAAIRRAEATGGAAATAAAADAAPERDPLRVERVGPTRFRLIEDSRVQGEVQGNG